VRRDWGRGGVWKYRSATATVVPGSRAAGWISPGCAPSALIGLPWAASRVRAEVPFAFNLGGERSLLITGYLDVLATEDEGTLVVDYKSDHLAGLTPAQAVARDYAGQRIIYALAVLLAGSAPVEVAFVFLERPHEPVSVRYGAGEVPTLRAGLEALAAGVRHGDFVVTPEPHRAICAGCPAEGGLCSWPLALTRRERPDQLF